MCHEWPVKKQLILRQSGLREIQTAFLVNNSMSPLRAQNKDSGTALETLLTRVRSCLECRLEHGVQLIDQSK